MKKYIFLFLVMISVFSLISYSTKKENNLDDTFSNTGFEILNTTKDSVLMYLTINAPSDSTWVQSVDGIFGINSSQLQGSVWVQPNDTLTYNPTLSFSGNVSFGTPPQNCPTDQLVNGVNLFEWSVNVPKGSNEGLDLSCMAGVNCIMKIDLIGGADWIANGKSVRVIQNKKMWHNTGIYGVFPYGCTNCTNTQGKQSCQTPNEKPNTEKICTPTRNTNEKGGKIRIKFLGYTPVPAK
jgi:hypothetical protein